MRLALLFYYASLSFKGRIIIGKIKDLFRFRGCEKKVNENIHISIEFSHDLSENKLHFWRNGQ